MTVVLISFNIIKDRPIDAPSIGKYVIDDLNTRYKMYMRGETDRLSTVLPKLLNAVVCLAVNVPDISPKCCEKMYISYIFT